MDAAAPTRKQKFFGSFFQKRTNFLSLLCLALTAAVPYTQIATVPLGEPEKWDYLAFDHQDGLVLIAHGAETTLVSAESNSVIGHLGPLDGAHGEVALDGKIYADSGKSSTLSIFDAKTFKKLETVPAGEDADAVIFDPAASRIMVMDGHAKQVTAIEPSSHAMTVIPLGGEPESAAADGKGAVFVNVADAAELARLDSGKVTARWKLPGCVSPHGMALDPATSLVFITCRNSAMLVVDGKTGAVRQTLPIGRGPDQAAFDPARQRVFSANGEGTLSIFQESQGMLTKLAELPTAPGARTMTVDERSGRLYLVTADVDQTLPPGHGGLVPHFSFKPGTAKLLVYAPTER